MQSYGYEPSTTPLDPYTQLPQYQVVYGQPRLVAQKNGIYPSIQAGMQDGGNGATPSLPYATYAITKPVKLLPFANKFPYPAQTGQRWKNGPGVSFLDQRNATPSYRSAYEAIANNVGFRGNDVHTY